MFGGARLVLKRHSYRPAKAQRYWAKFKHPLRDSAWVKRTTGILITETGKAQQYSDGLAVLISEKWGWDRKAEAEAKYPAPASLYYSTALPPEKRDDSEVVYNHQLGLIYLKKDAATIQGEDGKLIRLTEKLNLEKSALRRDLDAALLLGQQYKLRAEQAEQKATEIEQRLLEREPFNPKSWSEALKEFLEIGNKNGGKGNRPWSKVHAKSMNTRLIWWTSKLKVALVSEIALAPVELALAELVAAPKTRHDYLQTLVTFISWCVTHKYLRENPITKIKRPDKTIQEEWRALTLEEVKALLLKSPVERRLMYEMALITGLRAGELRALRVDQLDVINNCLRPKAEDAKNRKKVAQPLPVELAQRLAALAIGKLPNRVLLDLPRHPDREFARDAEKAGIVLATVEGKAVFHSLRKSFVTILQQHAGATLGETQKLARHSTPVLTANAYTKPSDLRQSALIESLGRLLA